MSFTEGEFEGFLQPSHEEIDDALQHGWVVLDANVLLGLYAVPARARDLAIRAFASLDDRLWVPYQVVREFWRNRPTRLSEHRKRANPVQNLRTGVAAVLNELSLTSRPEEDIRHLKNSINERLDELQTQLDEAAGDLLDWRAALNNSRQDPVVTALTVLLKDRVGSAPTDEAEMIAEGLRRFARKQPPGWIDGLKKAEQLPERGTGDYLLWEQTLRHLEDSGCHGPFVIVSDDEKEDWRLQYSKEFVLGAAPELVVEARARLGQPVYVLSSETFYDSIIRFISDVDTSTSAVLVDYAAANSVRQGMGGDWTPNSIKILMQRLIENGYEVQHAAIEAAMEDEEGFVARPTIYALGRYDQDRSLKGFSVPARRVALSLVSEGLLSESVMDPLVAKYDGTGRTIGYRVPAEFVSFNNQSKSKAEILTDIANLLDLASPSVATGGVVPKAFLIDCAAQLGTNPADIEQMGKPEIMRWIVELSGEEWPLSAESTGGTITRDGLALLHRAVQKLTS